MIQNQSTIIYIPILFYIYPSSKHNNISELWYRQHTTMKKRKKQNPYPAPTPGKVSKRSAGLSAVSAKDGEGEGGVRFTPPLTANVRIVLSTKYRKSLYYIQGMSLIGPYSC